MGMGMNAFQAMYGHKKASRIREALNEYVLIKP